MAIVISTRKLAPGDFADWDSRFASGAAARRDAGCRSVRRFRSVDDPDEVVVIFDWDTHEHARRFIENNVRQLALNNPDAPPQMWTVYVDELAALES